MYLNSTIILLYYTIQERETIMSSRFEKTGYLNSNFKIFHLRDFNFTAIESHFHDFHKVLIFINGDVTYQIEGRNYELHTNDIVFVPAGEVHKPTIHSQ